MEKAQRLAPQMIICDDDFKETWRWFRKFHHRQCLNTVILYGEGRVIDRDNLELLASLERLYLIVNEYYPSFVI